MHELDSSERRVLAAPVFDKGVGFRWFPRRRAGEDVQAAFKRIVGGVVAAACVGLLSSCSLVPPSPLYDDTDQIAKSQMQHIADAVKNHDAAALKSLFSPHARDKAKNLDEGLAYFLSVFPAGRMTYESEGVPSTDASEYGKETTVLYGNYKVSVGGKEFDLFFADYSIDTIDHFDNVGLYALGVAPYSQAHNSASGVVTPFNSWASQFKLVDHIPLGNPGVYVPNQ